MLRRFIYPVLQIKEKEAICAGVDGLSRLAIRLRHAVLLREFYICLQGCEIS